MGGRGRCADCGAINVVGAAFCTQCFKRDPVSAGATSSYAAPAPISPAFAMAQPVAAGFGRYPAPPPPVPITSTSGRGPVVWKWRHLWAFGFAAFGIPSSIERFLGTDASLTTLVDRSMLIAILGYLLGAVVLFALVRNEQRGDWTTLGLGRFDAGELALGAGFGLVLLGAFVPIGMLLNHGTFGLDPVVKLIVGGASGAGLVLVAIVVVIGAPIIEEIYFRGILYEKLGRRSIWLAIGVSTVLFTLAHGALLIPAILLLGLGLAVMRRTKSLWFTIGGHASWNLAITVVAATTLFGGGITFSPPGAAYSVDYESTWEASEEAARVFGPGVDLALGSARGSFAMFTMDESRKASAQETLTAIVGFIDKSGAAKAADKTEITPTDVDFAPIGAEGYEVGYMTAGFTREQPFFTTLVVVQKPGADKALYGEFRCVRSACMDDVYDFEEMLASIRLASL